MRMRHRQPRRGDDVIACQQQIEINRPPCPAIGRRATKATFDQLKLVQDSIWRDRGLKLDDRVEKMITRLCAHRRRLEHMAEGADASLRLAIEGVEGSIHRRDDVAHVSAESEIETGHADSLCRSRRRLASQCSVQIVLMGGTDIPACPKSRRDRKPAPTETSVPPTIRKRTVHQSALPISVERQREDCDGIGIEPERRQVNYCGLF